MRNDFTLILTLYKTNYKDLIRWKQYYERIKLKIPFKVLIDGDSDRKYYEKFFDPVDIVYNEDNVGRFLMVMNYLKVSNIKTKFIKILDPDDYIDVDKLINFPKLDGNFIFQFNHLTNNFHESEIDLDNIINVSENEFQNSFGTSWTFLPLKPLIDDVFFSGKEIRIYDDQVFGIIAFTQGYKIKNIDYSFYSYSYGIGESSNQEFVNNNLFNTLKYLNDYIEYLSNLKKIRLPLNSFTNNIINRFTQKDKYSNELLIEMERFINLSKIHSEMFYFTSFFDSNAFDLFKMQISSIVSTYNKITAYIGVSRDIFSEVKNYLENLEINFSIKIVDGYLESIDNDALFGTITKFTYCRFFIYDIFPEIDIESTLFYLDVDVMFNTFVPQYIGDSSDNIAITNSSYGNDRSLIWWESFFNKRSQEVLKKHRAKYQFVSNSIIEKTKKKKTFNAGIIVINNHLKFKELSKTILRDDLKILTLFDDQSLLNFYNNDHILIYGDLRINFKVNKDFEIGNKISIFHFLGKTKNLMKIFYDTGMNISNLPNNKYSVIDLNDVESSKIKFKKNKLTILLTIHEYTKINKINYWTTLYSMYGKDIDFKFLLDGIQPHSSIIANVRKEDILYSPINVGKFQLVYYIIKKTLVNTEYFKIVDPDDFLNIPNILSTNLETGYGIIKYQYTPLSNIVIDMDENIKDEIKKHEELIKSAKIKKENSFGNSSTILSTISIFNDKLYERDYEIRVNEDQVMGIIASINNNKTYKAFVSWYLYILDVGQLGETGHFEQHIDGTLLATSKILNKAIENKSFFSIDINWPGTIIGRLKNDGNEYSLSLAKEIINILKRNSKRWLILYNYLWWKIKQIMNFLH